MVEVSIELSSGAAPLHVAVRAENTQRAASIVVARYPGGLAERPLKPSENSLLASNEALRAELPGMGDQAVSAIESAFFRVRHVEGSL